MRIAYYALHYGKEYLAHSVRSVQDAVDEIHMLYTATPSFGHATAMSCPDSLDELKREAHRFATKPIIWHQGTWYNETQHRNAAVDIAKSVGASIIAVVDADELWAPMALAACLDFVEKTPKPSVHRYRAQFLHFWRSFDNVCRDSSLPERVIDVRQPSGLIESLPGDVQVKPVYHFGYAQSDALMRYKWGGCHGHQDELRAGWLDRFLNWQGQMDVHPTVTDLWNPEATDSETRADVQKLLGDHPYFGQNPIR